MEAVVPAWESLSEGLMAYPCGGDGEGDTPLWVVGRIVVDNM